MKIDEDLVRKVRDGGKLEDIDLKRTELEGTELAKQWSAASRAIEEKISPRGSLGLPAALDEARLTHGIPDEAFRVQAAFDRVFIWQIEDASIAGGIWGDGGIFMAPKTAAAEKHWTPRGILISAGLRALDALIGNGFDLGDIVTLVRLAPWRMRVGVINGVEKSVLVLQVGDLTGSEGLAQRIRLGECEVSECEGRHEIREHGSTRKRIDIDVPEEY